MMEDTMNGFWLILLNGTHYLFLAALVVLVGFFLVKLMLGNNKKGEGVKAHHRSGRRQEKNKN